MGGLTFAGGGGSRGPGGPEPAGGGNVFRSD